jgi:asparagine synthase (glutamine-hydrolysing)
MCGIVGFFEESGKDTVLKLEAMSLRLKARGPDDHGYWVCPDSGLGLAHRRLAILDLSPLGAQPMHSNSGRYVIVFNGEIYNYRAIQAELTAAGDSFRGGSDTEVMLAAIERWGLESAVKRFIGMFAFALFDRRDQILHLVRDRLGKKPLYYGWDRGVFYFASELKALLAHPRFSRQIDRRALALMLRYGYVPAPFSIYHGISRLAPGKIVSLTRSELSSASSFPPEHSYWTPEDLVTQAPFTETDAEIQVNFNTLLIDSVKLRMIADVPVGVFLSGGIDSSLVTSIMQELSTVPINSYSIGFDEQAFNEAPYAARIAKQLGTDHNEVYLSARDALNSVPLMAEVYDEPFGDQSQIPTLLVSQVARRHVTVALSGDGGDELFAGYSRYQQTDLLWKLLRLVPTALRASLSHTVRSLPKELWVTVFSLLAKVSPHIFSTKEISAKIDRLSHVLELKSFEQLYQRVLSFHEQDLCVVKKQHAIALDEIVHLPPTLMQRSRIERLMYIDLISYLVDDILVKVDRASMAVSLEARAPLLDHRIVEFAWRVPLHLKLHRGESKVLLRRALEQRLDKKLFERPKMGFGIPAAAWMRGELRAWCEDLLSDTKLAQHDLLDAALVKKLWSDFISGRDSYVGLLWNIVMFQSWFSGTQRSMHV